MALSLHNPDSTESDNMKCEETRASKESLREWNEIVGGRDPVEAMMDLLQMTIACGEGDEKTDITYVVLEQQTDLHQSMRAIKTPADLERFQQKLKRAVEIESSRRAIERNRRNPLQKLWSLFLR